MHMHMSCPGERLHSFHQFSRGFMTGRILNLPVSLSFPTPTLPFFFVVNSALSVLPASYLSLPRWIVLFVFWPSEAEPEELRSWFPDDDGGRQMARLLGVLQWVASGWAVRKMDGATMTHPEQHLLGGKWGIQDATHVGKLPLHWGYCQGEKLNWAIVFPEYVTVIYFFTSILCFIWFWGDFFFFWPFFLASVSITTS